MEILIYALIALFIIALIAGSIRQWWYHRKGEEVPDIQEPRPDGCCGQHEVCEKDSLLAAVSRDIEYYDDEEYEPVRKPRVFLLILYILLAVPVGLLGILLLIVPTLLFLVLAGLIITGGVMAVTSAFGSGIAVFADIMVIIGMAFILLALGLLALWIAVWLVGGVMVGLVRGLIHLGGKWCYKEVEA